MRYALVLTASLAMAVPALAQELDSPSRRPFSPISGPNNAVPSPICDLINFGFCPQPAGPAPVLPDLNEPPVARPVATAPAPGHRPARVRHRAVMQDG